MKRRPSFPWALLGTTALLSGLTLVLLATLFLLPVLSCPSCGYDLPGTRTLGPLATTLTIALNEHGFTQLCPLCGRPTLRSYWSRGLD